MKNFQTLHAHTINSDGLLTHTQVLNKCAQLEISTVAFTDHDALLNEKLLNHTKLALEARITRMQSIVKNLKGIGFDISEKDCLKASDGESVARPHIVKALLAKEGNIKNIDKIRLKMAADAEKNLEIRKKYDSMMEQGSNQFPYVLFLSEDSYLKNIYVDYQYFIDMDSSVKLIRDAGGVALLAHYFTVAHKIDEIMLEKFFAENRLDGAETVFGLFGLNTKSVIEEKITESRKIAKKLVAKYARIASGGADAHKNEDFEMFSKSGEYGNETVGMAENIVNTGLVDKTWSNLQ